MQVLVLLLVGGFVIGGTPIGRWLTRHPVALLVTTAIAASSFYSLRVVL